MLSYLYERGLADGHEQPQFADDVSYYLHMVSGGAEFRFTRAWDLGLTYVHRRKTFTSGLAGGQLKRSALMPAGRIATPRQPKMREIATPPRQ